MRPLIRVLPLLLLTTLACGKDDKDEAGDETGSPDQVGSVCLAPEDCYPNIDHTELAGEVQCLDRVPEGYCTHECASDEDCCAVEGECETTLPQVCSPFESTGQMMCFLSCEEADVSGAGAEDEQAPPEAARQVCHRPPARKHSPRPCMPSAVPAAALRGRRDTG